MTCPNCHRPPVTLRDSEQDGCCFETGDLDCERARSARLERERDEAQLMTADLAGELGIPRDAGLAAVFLAVRHVVKERDAALSELQKAHARHDADSAILAAASDRLDRVQTERDAALKLRDEWYETASLAADRLSVALSRATAAEEGARGLGEALEDCYAQAPEWYRRKHGDYVEEQLAAWRKP